MAGITREESGRLQMRIKIMCERGLSMNEMARQLGKTPQAVQQFIKRHDLETAAMRQSRLNRKDVDNMSGKSEDRTAQGRTGS